MIHLLLFSIFQEDFMNYKRILQGILDIGEAMLKSGAENFRLEDSLYRMCKGYGFIHYDVFVIPSNIQITVETPDGDIITQIRHIEATDINFDRLDYLDVMIIDFNKMVDMKNL